MNEASSRFADRWLGVPLCWLLTRWRRCRAWFAAPPSGEPPQGILFLKLAEMGAVVLTLPAFEAAARRVGRERLFIAMLEGNRQVHDLVGFFRPENVVTIRDRNLWTFAVDAWRLLRFCRRQRIDAVIDLEGFARISAILAYLSGARIRVGLERFTTEGPYRGDLATHRVAWNAYQHASQQFLTLVSALDCDPRELPLVKQAVRLDDYRLPRFEPTEAEREAARGLVARASGGLPPRPWIVFNPNLIDLLPLRRWPAENYRELGRRLLNAHPTATILLAGLPDERELSRALAREIAPERCYSLAGETQTLRSLVTLFTECALLLTSDSGPAHMAALTDLPIVSLFGPETPQLYAPLSPHNRSLWAGLACSPCLNALNHRRSICRNNVCLQTLSVDEVWRACREQCPELTPKGK